MIIQVTNFKMSQLKYFKFDKDVLYDKNEECLCVSLKEIQNNYKKLPIEHRLEFSVIHPTFSNWTYFQLTNNAGIINSISSNEKFHNGQSNIAFIVSLERVKYHKKMFNTSLPQVIFTGENLKKWSEIQTLMIEIKPIEVDECCICMSNFKNIDYCFLKCGHKFHCTCLFKYLNTKNQCPTCREILDIEQTKTFSEKHPIFTGTAIFGGAIVVGIPMAIVGVTSFLVARAVINIYSGCKNLLKHRHTPLSNQMET